MPSASVPVDACATSTLVHPRRVLKHVREFNARLTLVARGSSLATPAHANRLVHTERRNGWYEVGPRNTRPGPRAQTRHRCDQKRGAPWRI